MAPVHDTDVAEERWSKEEWRTFELWEKIEVRARRRKRLWIAGAVFVFLCLSTIPVFVDRLPKWQSLQAGRNLAEVLNRIKKEAALHHNAYALSFENEEKLSFRVLKGNSCDGNMEEVSRGVLLPDETQLLVLSPQDARLLDIPGVADRFCYSSLQGWKTNGDSVDLSAFVILSVKDLTEKRLDRLTTILIRGLSAEISFN